MIPLTANFKALKEAMRDYHVYFLYEHSSDGVFIDPATIDKWRTTILAFSYAHAIEEACRIALQGRAGWRVDRAHAITLGRQFPYCHTHPPTWRAKSLDGHSHIYFAVYAEYHEVMKYEKTHQ